MDIYIYSDESGVLDKKHNDIYVFGGVAFINKEEKNINARKYQNVERCIRQNKQYTKEDELKACILKNKDKAKIYRSLNACIKFGVVINQKEINDNIFNNKKSKQRYLDYAYKICLKRMFEDLIKEKKIDPDEVENIYIFADEHSTATDGRYELREGLEQEFRFGTFNYSYNKYYPPIFLNLKNIDVHTCNSKTVTLIRAADIVANNIYYKAVNRKEFKKNKNLYLCKLP